ncbi:hypothetical protein V1517DRAFT_318598 [Lipomyces orientalis]|uniref:Uncharacterized protein n=1 Tax=Lipomyces orientalis TaxID=1233043 RepID=A0ACC3TSC8_9ASCO
MAPIKYPSISFPASTAAALRHPSTQATLFIRILQVIISTIVLGIAGYNLNIKAYGVQAAWIYVVIVSGSSLLLTLWFLFRISRYTVQDYCATHAIWCVLWLAALSVQLHYVLTPLPCASFDDETDVSDIVEWFERNSCEREIALLSFMLAAVIIWVGCAVLYSSITYFRRISGGGDTADAPSAGNGQNGVVEKAYEDGMAQQHASPKALSNIQNSSRPSPRTSVDAAVRNPYQVFVNTPVVESVCQSLEMPSHPTEGSVRSLKIRSVDERLPGDVPTKEEDRQTRNQKKEKVVVPVNSR